MKATALLPFFFCLPVWLNRQANILSLRPSVKEQVMPWEWKEPDFNPDTCIAVPSAFTPNADGKNDKIGPIENGCRIRALLFRIYNRRGQVVFMSEYIGNDWDGTVNGAPQDAGYYPYICYYTPEGGVNKMFTGTITLFR